jgi:hypothetical protein
MKNPTYVGIGLNLIDSGTSYSDLGLLALNAIGAKTNDARGSGDDYRVTFA